MTDYAGKNQDLLTRYYPKKANLRVEDEYYSDIDMSDIAVMKRAQLYLFVTPPCTLAFMYGLKHLRNMAAYSSHFSFWGRGNRNQYRPESDYQQTGSSPEPSANTKAMNDLYKQAKADLDNQSKRNQSQGLKNFKNFKGAPVRNIDPFEKKRNFALNQEGGISKSITSKRDRDQLFHNKTKTLTPSEYMDGSQKQYYQNHVKPQGSYFTQQLKQIQTSEMNLPKHDEGAKMGDKQRKYLRSFKFGFIKDTFNRVASSSHSSRRATFLFYFLPCCLTFGGAVQNYLQQTFAVYLKYQAMIDRYNDKLIEEKEEAAKLAVAAAQTA